MILDKIRHNRELSRGFPKAEINSKNAKRDI